jgi:class 3 adenylate cyclase
MDVHRREVVAMFTDVTGFTSMVECIAPELLGRLLNEYMAGMTEIGR